MNDNEVIIFFDGHCNLCNGFVNFILKWDLNGKFKLASLQGKTAKEQLAPQLLQNLDSVVLKMAEQEYIKSSAVIRILGDLHWLFKPIYLFLVIPRFIRDPLYGLISKNRYRLFGRRETCRLPAAKEKARFLD